MSFAAEIATFFRPDMGGLPVDQLVTPLGLWLRNSAIHFGMGWAAYIALVYYGWSPRRLWLLAGAYVALQIVQLAPAPHVWLALLDGIADVLILAMGWFSALTVTARDPWGRS